MARTDRMAALGLANEVRIARSQLKRDIRAGKVTAAEVVLLSPTPDWLQRMRVEQLILSAFGFKRRTCQRILLRSRVTPATTMGSLTSAQREMLVAELCEHAERRDLNRHYKRARPYVSSVPSVGRAA